MKKRTASKIKKEMEKMPKLKKNKEQLEGDQEQLQVVLGQRMMNIISFIHEQKMQGLFKGLKCQKVQLYSIKENITELFSDTKSQVSASTISIGLSSKQFSDLRSNQSASKRSTRNNIKSLQDTLFSNKSSLKHLVFDAQ